MAKLIYALNQSLDGYVDHMKLGPPVPEAFRHFVEHVRGLTGMVYGRGMYEIMRYWAKIFLIGTRTIEPSRWRGGACRSGWCRAL